MGHIQGLKLISFNTFKVFYYQRKSQTEKLGALRAKVGPRAVCCACLVLYLAKEFWIIFAEHERGTLVVNVVAAVAVLDGVAGVAEQIFFRSWIFFASDWFVLTARQEIWWRQRIVLRRLLLVSFTRSWKLIEIYGSISVTQRQSTNVEARRVLCNQFYKQYITSILNYKFQPTFMVYAPFCVLKDLRPYF
jgi:hypothetical protein